MGEYGKFAGRSVKIGTCEDMMYLRADQAHLIEPETGSLNPSNPGVQEVIRFRFPFPDEDDTKPGEFKDYDRSIPVWGVTVPAEVEHYSVQFVARAGYLLSLPCPEGPSTHGLNVHRNGFGGPVRIVQQAYRGGALVLICQCGGCGARYNLPTLAEAEPIIVACRAEADKREREHKVGPYRDKPMDGQVSWWHAVADRIAAGYAVKAPVEVQG